MFEMYWSRLSLLRFVVCSGRDGTVRIWSLPNRTHQFLQQTCVFNKGDEICGEDLDGHMLTHTAWNANGKLIAAAIDNLVNIWIIAGKHH